ncbi:hypothetical protein NE235_04270 [Actinoallomurus spadix]|uniref:DUF6973 domain-containing protein n=1 Tax=Actinoallomurus spadix TaxID=79912 RepID=A0ABN0W0U8_9ACTN|nr:hypothetical protein [Actinoallomurus spadix]MCO5985319.1 hypothetical protein [Actinoallomurus spadix]
MRHPSARIARPHANPWRAILTLALVIAATIATSTVAVWTTPAHADPTSPGGDTGSAQTTVEGTADGTDAADADPSPGYKNFIQRGWDTYTAMTPPEKAVCDENKAQCIVAGRPYSFAYNNAAQVAGVTEQKQDDKADAARHCVWQLGLTTWFGADYAKKWGDAHEQNSDEPRTHAMDLHNNIVARSMAGDPTLVGLADLYKKTKALDSYDRTNDRILQLCRDAIAQAVQVTYTPASSPDLAHQVTPDPADTFVYFTANP